MPKYRATLQLSGISGESPRAVRSALAEQLRNSGLANCRVVSIDLDAPPAGPSGPRPPQAGEESAWRSQTNLGGVLLVSAAAWAMWFFWWMLSATPE